MDVFNDAATPSPVGQGAAGATGTAAQSKKARADEGEKSIIETIREAGGFEAFLKQMEKEKLEKMREEILQAMGLSEQALEEMPAEQRAEIEKMIAQEIRSRLAAGKMAQDEKSPTERAAMMDATQSAPADQSAGFGVMLALQEAQSKTIGDAMDPAKTTRLDDDAVKK